MSATLPIIKSDSANNFILMLERVWVWLGMERKNGRMFGLTTHQQSYLRGPSTTHGIVASQIITKEMRIVLFWTLIKKSGMTSNAILVAMWLPMSFVKGQDTLKMICHQK